MDTLYEVSCITKIDAFDRFKSAHADRAWRAGQWPAAARDVQYQRDTNKQMLQLWCWWEKPEPFICQRPVCERQHHLIPSPSIDVTTSICGQFALVISYPSSFWAPGPDFYFCSLLFVTMWHRWHIYPFNVSQMSNQPIAWQQFKDLIM